ncbi:MAG: cyanophycin synthetase [Burkholderiaceae bacterium]
MVPGRTATGAELIDDTYNANPDSVLAAIDVLAARSGRRILVLGDMGEVGAQGPAFHREVGLHARASGIDSLLALGELSREAVTAFGDGGRHHDSLEALVGALQGQDLAGAVMLVKGSRFMRMERVVDALKDEPAREGAH